MKFFPKYVKKGGNYKHIKKVHSNPYWVKQARAKQRNQNMWKARHLLMGTLKRKGMYKSFVHHRNKWFKGHQGFKHFYNKSNW